MTAIIRDVRNDIYTRIDRVEMLCAERVMVKDRLVDVWRFYPEGGGTSQFPQRGYQIDTIEK